MAYPQPTQQRFFNAPNDAPTSATQVGGSKIDDPRYNGAYPQPSNSQHRQRGNSYEQYDGNSYADEGGAQGAGEEWNDNQGGEQGQYANYGPEYDQRAYDQQRPPPNRQRMGPPSRGGPMRPMNGPPDHWMQRAGGPSPPNGRDPGYAPGPRGNGPGMDGRGRPPQNGYGQYPPGPGYDPRAQRGQYGDRRMGPSQPRNHSRPTRPPGQGYPMDAGYGPGPNNYSRSGRGAPPGQDYGPDFRPPPPRSHSRPRQPPNETYGGDDFRPPLPTQHRSHSRPRQPFPAGERGHDYRPSNGSERPDYSQRHGSGGKPPSGQTSPIGRNFDNPFPVFPNGNNPSNAPSANASGPDGRQKQNYSKHQSELYNGIVAHYAGEEPPLPNNRNDDVATQDQRESYPFSPQSPQSLERQQTRDQQDNQAQRPGTAPGAPNSGRPFPTQNAQRSGPDFHMQFPDRSIPATTQQQGAYHPDNVTSQNMHDYGRPPPQQELERQYTRESQRSQNNGTRPEYNGHPRSGPNMQNRQGPDDRANSLPGRPFPPSQPLVQQWSAGPPRPFQHESRPSAPEARQMAALPPVPQNSFGRTAPGPPMPYINGSGPGTALPAPPPIGEFADGRPSMDGNGSYHPLRSKGSNGNLPNRANVERPNFYQATGVLPHSPPPDASRQPQPPPNPASRGIASQAPPSIKGNPDALPHHATPAVPSQPKPNAQPSRPPPVRTYKSDPDPSKQAAGSNANKKSPVSQEELSRLREAVRKNPADNGAHLALAKRLAEASTTLADEGGRADPRTRDRNRQAYNAEAHKLVKKLVGAGYPDAMFYMAECYGEGSVGLQVDAKEAFNLYQAAAKQGHGAAAYRTAVCCEIGPEEGGGTRRDLEKAFQWYKRASSLGDVPATYKMGVILLKGLLGQQQNPAEAVSYLKRAAERADAENPHALHELGLLYESSKNPGVTPRDEPQAFQLFTKAAKLGYKFSQFKLGQAYEYGLLGCTVDARTSIIWYTKAAAQGEHQSELALSGWYLTGSEGILEHSDIEAYLWARKAALADPPLPKAMFAMGYFTEVGIGCPRSLEEAKRWYGRAAAYKFPKAQEHLEELQRGGSKMQRNRETISRNQKKDADCSVM